MELLDLMSFEVSTPRPDICASVNLTIFTEHGFVNFLVNSYKDFVAYFIDRAASLAVGLVEDI